MFKIGDYVTRKKYIKYITIYSQLKLIKELELFLIPML